MGKNKTPQKDPVEKQYEEWLYPPPLNCLELPYCANYLFDHYMFWPDREDWGETCVLIAGCGTNQGACFAYHNPKLQIVGIDVSAASLAHENQLKKDYRLDNLTLHHLPLEDVASLEREFDLIFAHGVLHHLRDPAAGLRALAGVLSREGAINLMLYGRYGRAGVYMLQDLFRKLGLEQTGRDVELAREALSCLPSNHPVGAVMQSAPFVRSDSGVVDTFLHKRDVAYTVDECLELLSACGLAFQGWNHNMLYYPDAYFPRGEPLYERIDGLGEADIWRTMELVSAPPKHQLTACRKDRPKTYVIDFEGDAFLGYVPVKREAFMRKMGPSKLDAMNYFEINLFRQFDGTRTVGECMEGTGFRGGRGGLEDAARRFVRYLWRIGYIYIKKNK
jgi:SAM-dependent methyltransferase